MSYHTQSTKELKEPPEWFKLENYSELNRLTTHGWFKQIEYRALISELLEEEHRRDLAKTSFLKSIKAPVVNDEFLQRDRIGLTVRILNQPSVEPINLFSLLYCANKLKDDLIDLDKRLNKASTKLPQDTFKSIDELIHDREELDIGDSNTARLRINLHYPDELIISRFRDLLPDLRKRQALHPPLIEKKPRWFNFDNWVRHAIIPYFDITTWLNLEGITITDQTMADWIFPHGEGGIDVLRSSTKVNTKKIFSLESRRYLYQLSSSEYYER